jgi:chorismate lyase / 3-hydroxybenzoate synthase
MPLMLDAGNPSQMIMSYRPANTVEGMLNTSGMLAIIDFADDHARSSDPCRFTVGLPPLRRTEQIETWEVEQVIDSGWVDGIGFVVSPDLLLAHCLVEETDPDDLARVTFDLYRKLLAFFARRGYPHPLRIWNVIEAIHDPAAGLERYQAFSAGRARAFDAAGFRQDQIPAASAIGSAAPGLLIYALASRHPGTAVENPRQTPAYRYPSQYGPRAPYFARATHARGLNRDPLFISGTASVVGHQSLHPAALGEQTAETLRNLSAITHAAGCAAEARPQLLKVYLRYPHEASEVEAAVRTWAGLDAEILVLRGDICRLDLDIEIEGLRLS